jgi:hypothetical protein
LLHFDIQYKSATQRMLIKVPMFAPNKKSYGQWAFAY